MGPLTLYVGNSMELQLANLVDSGGGAVAGASVEATIYEADGTTQVTGTAWPVAMPYSGGVYTASLPPDLGVVAGYAYRVQVVATLGNAKLKEVVTVQAKTRTG